jgi:hypothetical protein
MSDQNEKQANDPGEADLKAAHQLGFMTQALGSYDKMTPDDATGLYNSSESYANRNSAVAETLVEQANSMSSSK